MPITKDLLRAALARPLLPTFHGYIDASNARPAGVVLPIALDPEPILYLVLRSSHLADHAGEVGFPGGKPEPADADLRATAAREAAEEVDLKPADLEWLGALTPCPVITGRYMIHPFVAAVAPGVAPRVASGEIERVLELPLRAVLSGELPIFAVKGEWRGIPITAPHFPIGGSVLYGASAYIVFELLAKIAAELGRDLPPLRFEDAPPWGNRYTRAE